MCNATLVRNFATNHNNRNNSYDKCVSSNNHKLIIADYQNFRKKLMQLFPLVDGGLILDIFEISE